MLSIDLLGSPQLLLDQRPLTVTRRRNRALVYYLAAAAAPVKRDSLLLLFWSDHDRTAAQQILRTTLHSVRKTLGSALLTPDDSVALAPDVVVDARRLEAGLSQPDAGPDELAATLALYRGDFLDGFSLTDCIPFEDWMFAERERYRQLTIRGFTSLAQQYETQRQFEQALNALTQALAFDPLQEDLQRVGIRLHYLAGDRVGAIRRYEQLRTLLDEEMGVPPMAETRALYDAIITDTLVVERSHGATLERSVTQTLQRPDRQPTATLPFIGRHAELDRLAALTESSKCILIEGEAGIGKTRLAEEFLHAQGKLALAGAARELEQALPYQPIIEALRKLLASPAWPELRARLDLAPVWLAEVTRLLPELAEELLSHQPALSPADESRLWEGLTRFLLALAHQRPLVLFLDDLHWADAATLALLGYLVRQVESAPVGFLATTRPVEPRSPLASLLQALTREDRLERICLHRLTAQDTVALARQLSPTYAYPLAEWLSRNGEGNPYILAELLRYAREHQLLSRDGILNLAALSVDPVVPPSVYSLIHARLARLSDEARRVLDAAVAVGREFEFEVAARAAALSEPAALDALDELQSATLLHPVDGLRYAFDHSLTMEVAYREVGEPRHRLLHRRVAEALESVHRQNLEPFVGLIASHFAEGNAPERASHYAFRAAQRAAGLAAWTEAIAFYEQALTGAPDDQRLAITIELGEAYLHAGEAARASETLRAALNLALQKPGAAATDVNAVRLVLAHSLLPQSRYAEAIVIVQQVQATDRVEHRIKSEFIWGTALSLEGADLAEAATHLQRAEALLCGQPALHGSGLLAQIRFELGGIAAQQGDLALAIARYREALLAAESAGTEPAIQWLILARNNLAYNLHLLGDPEADAHVEAGMRLAQERGYLGLQPYLCSTLGEIALARHDLEAAEAHFIRGLRIAERLDIPERIAGLTANLGLVALRRNQRERAIHHLSRALARADTLGTRHLAAQIRIWLAPLLPPAEAQSCIAEARAIAASGNRRRLLSAIARIEDELMRWGGAEAKM
jgi:DNA-binding SARP family transcriptional activator